MKAQVRTLQSKGSGWDTLLFSQFRSDPKTAEGARVEELLSLLVSANQHLEAWKKEVPLTSKSAFLAAMQERNRSEFAYFSTIEKLNEVLSRYKWLSTFEGDLNGFRETLKMEDKVRSGYPAWEHAVVRLLLDRIREPGELDRFRHCADCQNWFFAATAHQRFCGDACRRHHTAASDEFKVKRRMYMKHVYRPQQKERDERMEELAKGKNRAKKKGTK